MKIHHLNCGSMCPVGSHIFPSIFPKEVVCHCLLIETANRLVLVDTGLGVRDIKNPKRLGLMSHVLNVTEKIEFSAIEQVKKLGFSPTDVSDLIPTHLDLDHAGGIPDFKWARVHVSISELEAATSRNTFRFKERYRPCHLEADTKWVKFDLKDGEAWNGFESAKEVNGLPPEILLVRLPGHTPGHTGIAISTANGWLLHAGDAYYDHRELEKNGRASPGLRFFQRVAHTNFDEAMATQKKLLAIKNVQVVCSHDPFELKRASR